MAEIVRQLKYTETLAAGTAYTHSLRVDDVNFVSIQLNTAETGVGLVQVSNDEGTPAIWFDAPSANIAPITLTGDGGFFSISDVACRWLRVKLETYSGGDVETLALLKDA
jgi:hypothetical protein